MSIALDAASPAVLVVASEWVMCKVLHADLSYLWKIPLGIKPLWRNGFPLSGSLLVWNAQLHMRKAFIIRFLEKVVLEGGECTEAEGCVSTRRHSELGLPLPHSPGHAAPTSSKGEQKCSSDFYRWESKMWRSEFSKRLNEMHICQNFVWSKAIISYKPCCCSQALEVISNMSKTKMLISV